MKRTSLVISALALVVFVLLLYLATDGRGLLKMGLSYPSMGLTHLIAAIGVVVWSSRLGGDAPVALPVVFAAAIGMGYVLAAEEVPLLLFVEPMLWVSALTLALAAAYVVRAPLSDAIGVTALFGLYHGHALGELGSAEIFLINPSVLTSVPELQTLSDTLTPSLPP